MENTAVDYAGLRTLCVLQHRAAVRSVQRSGEEGGTFGTIPAVIGGGVLHAAPRYLTWRAKMKNKVSIFLWTKQN